jgi:hypothetical protein
MDLDVDMDLAKKLWIGRWIDPGVVDCPWTVHATPYSKLSMYIQYYPDLTYDCRHVMITVNVYGVCL